MKIAIASDHRGFIVKNKIKDLLTSYEVCDCGPFIPETVDYPDFAEKACFRVIRYYADAAILICGTGIGMCMCANKFPGCRAAVCNDALTAELSRKHNNCNVLCLSGNNPLPLEDILFTWLNTEFEGGRHQPRVDKMRNIERIKNDFNLILSEY